VIRKLAFLLSFLVFALICGCGGSSPAELSPTGSYRIVDLDPGATIATPSHNPLGISQTGVVVGGGGRNNSAVLYSQGKWTDLPSLPGADVTAARAVNANKQAVGFSYPAHIHACSWINGSLFDISPAGSEYSEAMAINEYGRIAGYASWAASFTLSCGIPPP
jgi:uncharacterized membrane protein